MEWAQCGKLAIGRYGKLGSLNGELQKPPESKERFRICKVFSLVVKYKTIRLVTTRLIISLVVKLDFDIEQMDVMTE